MGQFKGLKEARKLSTAKPTPDQDWAKIIEALTKLLEVLKGLPVWVAIFLAGLALLWTRGGVERLCPLS